MKINNNTQPKTALAAFIKVDFFGIPFAIVGSTEQAAEKICAMMESQRSRPFIVSCANPLSIRLLQRDSGYLANLRRMDAVFSDGIGVTWAARWLKAGPIERLSFDSGSFAPIVFRQAAAIGNRVALVGGAAGVADGAAECILKQFPTLNIVGTVHGYATTDEIVRRTLETAPDLVICGMGMPRQEAVLCALADKGWAGCGFTCGGYLDQLNSRFDYYPALVNRFNLRLPYRVFREPRRMGRRFFVAYPPFFFQFLRAAIGRERRVWARRLVRKPG